MRDFEVDADIVKLQPGIHEVCLRLKLVAGPQVGIDAQEVLEVGTEQFDLLADPEAELTPGKLRVVDDAVEPAPLVIVDVVVARGVEGRRAKSNPVGGIGEFDGSHRRPDIDGLECLRVERVVADHVVERTRDVELVDVTVVGEPEVAGVHFVGLGEPDRIGTHEKTVLVVLDAGLVVVVMKARLHRMAGPDEVLAIVVGDEDVLAAVIEGVEKTVGVLFPLVEDGDIELIAVCLPRSKEADRTVQVAEDETPEIARERLRPAAH